MAGSVADAVPRLREVSAEVVASWVGRAESYLTDHGFAAAAARSLTHAFLAALDRASAVARTSRGPSRVAAWAQVIRSER